MTALFLLFVAATWLVVAAAISYAASVKVKTVLVRVIVAVAVFAVLLPLPLIDEIVGSRQFESLCKANATTIQVDRVNAVGRTVYLAESRDIDVQGTWVRVVFQPRRFLDATTHEPVLTYNILIAGGGRLIRVLAISDGGMPLTFSGICRPEENPRELFKSLRISAKDRSEVNVKGNLK